MGFPLNWKSKFCGTFYNITNGYYLAVKDVRNTTEWNYHINYYTMPFDLWVPEFGQPAGFRGESAVSSA